MKDKHYIFNVQSSGWILMQITKLIYERINCMLFINLINIVLDL